MDKQRIQELANAIAHWLANKRLSGFGEVLSEALLVIPIAEFLLSHGYVIVAEQDTQKTFGIGGSGNVNYDLVANKELSKALFELKFLKEANDPRLLTDLVKLAFSKEKSDWEWSRLLVIAHHNSGESVSKLVREIVDAVGHSFNLISKEDGVELTHNGKIQSIEKERILKIMGHDRSLKSFRVERSALSTEGKENVLIFSVYR